MSKSSLAKTWAEILFIGPLLSWRIVEMAVASAHVIKHRSPLVIKGPKTRREQKEYRTMIHEKIQGAGEAWAASFTSFNKDLLRSTSVWSSITETISAGRSLFNVRSYPWNYLRFSGALGWLFIALTTEGTTFYPKLFLKSTQPLKQRVTANARRLKKQAPRL